MPLIVEPDDPVSIYQQIRDRIVEMIASGSSPPGAARMLAVPEDREIGMLQLARILELEKARSAALGKPTSAARSPP